MSIGSTLASAALRGMFNSSISTVEDQNRIGYEYTRDIARQTGSRDERVVADTTVSAANSASNQYSRLGVLDAGLKSIQGGLGGSIGPTLARIGKSSMHNNNIRTVEDQDNIGPVFARTIANETGSQSEKIVANAMVSAANSASNAYSKLGCLDAGFNVIAAGVGGSIGPVLAQLAKDSMHNDQIRTVEDQNNIGLTLGRALANATGSQAEETIVNTVINATNSASNLYSRLGVLNAGMNSLAAGVGGCVSRTLASIASNAMHNDNIRTVQDQNSMAYVFARAVRDTTSDSTQRTLAQATLDSANRVSDPYARLELYDNFFNQAK